MMVALGALHADTQEKLRDILHLLLGLFNAFVPSDWRIPQNSPARGQQFANELVVGFIGQ